MTQHEGQSMNTVPYRQPIVIPYDVQEFVSGFVHEQCSPPRAAKLLPICLEALERYVLGDLLARLPLPEGCSNDGSRLAPVWLLVEEFGLDLFADQVRLANGFPDSVPLEQLVPPGLATP
jgi:hypothetical protein